MLAENISRIDLARNVREYNVSSGDGFSDKMKREHIVLFVQFRMELDATIDNRLVISKDVALLVQWNSQVTKRRTQIYDLLNASTHGNHLAPIGGDFDCGLFLREPFDRSLVGEVEDTC